jgi:hypothetical protein
MAASTQRSLSYKAHPPPLFSIPVSYLTFQDIAKELKVSARTAPPVVVDSLPTWEDNRGTLYAPLGETSSILAFFRILSIVNKDDHAMIDAQF